MMLPMRTTLTIDDDVAAKLQELAHSGRTSFKAVVNAVLRRGLAAQELSPGEDEPYEVAVFRSDFRPGVDPLKLNQLVDELEVRRFAGEGR
jgi:predicted CopG family antitoxin